MKVSMSISEDGFNTGCHTLCRSWQRLTSSTEWEHVKILEDYGKSYLRITKHLSTPNHLKESHQEDENELVEADAEVLEPAPKNTKDRTVIYDIVYSPTYQVPVLYISIQTTGQSNRVPPPDEVFDLLVPPPYRSQMRGVGVMGALSMTEHPVSGLPVYFVHPCRTAEAMQTVTGAEAVEPFRYLCLWLGLVGGSVGLNVPAELAMQS